MINQVNEFFYAWWDWFKDNMESLGLSQKDIQFRNKWRRIKGGIRFTWKNGRHKNAVCVIIIIIIMKIVHMVHK